MLLRNALRDLRYALRQLRRAASIEPMQALRSE
jgi:hypothetical protein